MDLRLLKKKNHEYWNAQFKDPAYDYRQLIERDWSSLIEWLESNKVKDVLDLGCGYGHWSIVLARAGFSVKAVDYATSAIAVLREWSVEQALSIDCEVKRIQALVSESEFDAVICNSVLDHMIQEDARLAMSKIKQALRPGGIAYVSFDGPNKETNRYTQLDDGTKCYREGRLTNMLWRYYTAEEIRELCRGFKIVRFSIRDNGKRDVWVRKLEKRP